MQHVLSLDEENSQLGRFTKEAATPDLKDSPQQKEFIMSIEEFRRKLITVVVLSLVIVAIGIIGTFLCKSKQLQLISYVALGLNLNWVAGFLAAKKVDNELLRVQYDNLNGQTGFEGLMIYCQVQIMIIIGIYLYCLNLVRNIMIELKEMDVLALKDNG